MKRRMLFLVRVISVLVLMMCLLSVVVSASDSKKEGYFTYTVSGGFVTIEKCDTNASGDIVIPDTIDGYEGPFAGCDSLTKIELPDSVTTINSYAFSRFPGQVIIGENVTTIEEYAFYNCYQLESIDIPDKVTYIGEAYLVNNTNM